MEEAKLYTTINLMVMRDFIEFMDRQRDRLKNHSSQCVLDVGCGPGDLTAKMAKAYFPPGSSVTGCDSSENMVAYATNTNSNEDVTFKVLNIESQNIFETWEKATYDVIVSNLCFQWVKNQRLAAGNMFGLLKEGGQLFINFLVEHPFMTALRMVSKRNDLEKYTKGIDYFNIYPKDTALLKSNFTELFKCAGFKEVEVVSRKSYYCWPTLDGVLSAMTGVDPYRKFIPDSMMDLYTRVLREALLATKTFVVEKGGWVKLEYDVCEIYAKK